MDWIKEGRKEEEQIRVKENGVDLRNVRISAKSSKVSSCSINNSMNSLYLDYLMVPSKEVQNLSEHVTWLLRLSQWTSQTCPFENLNIKITMSLHTDD